MKKLAEFNFKVLHNIVPNGIKISKWDKTISSLCDYCKMPENTEHMLYKCSRIKCLWSKISRVLGINVSWKTLVCGFIKRELTEKLKFYNLVLTLIMYGIFKQNSRCKFEKQSYANVNVSYEVKLYLAYFKVILEATCYDIYSDKIFNDIISCI